MEEAKETENLEVMEKVAEVEEVEEGELEVEKVEEEVEEVEEMLRNLTAETSLGKLVPTWQSNCHADKGPKANTNFHDKDQPLKPETITTEKEGQRNWRKTWICFVF